MAPYYTLQLYKLKSNNILEKKVLPGVAHYLLIQLMLLKITKFLSVRVIVKTSVNLF